MRLQHLLAFLAITLSGCATTQLRRSSTKIGRTVDDVIQQQVLDNLAKFKRNPDAIPHFAYPAGAQSTVRDSISGSSGLGFSRWTLGGWDLGFGAGRDDSEGFTTQPITDPYKLDLMRCVYQRALYGNCGCPTGEGCPDCDRRFNKFYFGTESPPQVARLTADGKKIYWWSGELLKKEDVAAADQADASNSDEEETPQKPKKPQFIGGGERELYVFKNEFGDDVFATVGTTQPILTDPNEISALLAAKKLRPMYEPGSLAALTNRLGRVTPACLTSGWVCVGDPDGRANNPCCPTGEYCGTKIWVPRSAIDQLSILTLLVLEIAQHEEASVPVSSKPQQHEIILTMREENQAVQYARESVTDEPTSEGFFTPYLLRPSDVEIRVPEVIQQKSLPSLGVDLLLNERTRETLAR